MFSQPQLLPSLSLQNSANSKGSAFHQMLLFPNKLLIIISSSLMVFSCWVFLVSINPLESHLILMELLFAAAHPLAALVKLSKDCTKMICCSMKVPFLFLTNGGGVPESQRALELSELLGVNIMPCQIVQGHSLFRNLLGRYQDELIVATGKGEPALVMSEYGFNKVLSIDEYASYFKDIDPVSQYKNWKKSRIDRSSTLTKLASACDVYTEKVKAAFVVSDPVDWGSDIQVLCDILRTGDPSGLENGGQPALYFAADDLEYQAAFPDKRLGVGAFRIALESIFNRVHHTPLECVIYGKPLSLLPSRMQQPLLRQIHCDLNHESLDGHLNRNQSKNYFSALYIVGDNPSVDIKGATQAGDPWISVLIRTGMFQGKGNHEDYPADLAVDTVEDAVNFILEKEFSSGHSGCSSG